MSARDLFQQIKVDQWAGVQNWVNNKAEESRYLEFKRKEKATEANLSEVDKKNISKACSSFANTEGGVVVFGVGTNQGKPDHAFEILRISHLADFQNRVRNSVEGLTDPPVMGIEIERIEDPSNPGTGVLLIYVPQSDGGPHRTKAKQEDGRYLMRVDDHTGTIPHSLLASMFGRRPAPDLRVLVTAVRPDRTAYAGPGWPDKLIALRISNVGRGTADAVVFRIDVESESECTFHNTSPEWTLTQHQGLGRVRSYFFRGNNGGLVYPGSSQELTWAELPLFLSPNVNDYLTKFRAFIYAREMQSVEIDVTRSLIVPGGKWLSLPQ